MLVLTLIACFHPYKPADTDAVDTSGLTGDTDTDTDTDTDSDSDADGDADTDADTDADSDADTDADGDTDTDTDTDTAPCSRLDIEFRVEPRGAGGRPSPRFTPKDEVFAAAVVDNHCEVPYELPLPCGTLFDHVDVTDGAGVTTTFPVTCGNSSVVLVDVDVAYEESLSLGKWAPGAYTITMYWGFPGPDNTASFEVAP